MKKKIILLFFVLFLTGCTANYDLYIGEKFTDDIILTEDNDKLESIEHYNMEEETTFNIENLSYQVHDFEKDFSYDREEIFKENTSGYRYHYTYNSDNIDEKSMVYDCYDSIIIEHNKEIVIDTSNTFKCFEKYDLLDEVIVNIHYDGEYINSNADSYGNGLYTWKISKDTYDNERIYLRVKRIKKNYTFNIIGAAVFCILTVISIIIIIRRNKT